VSARVFVEPARLRAGSLEIGGSEHHYLARVRRLRAGDELVVCDGEGREAPARLVRVDKGGAILEVREPAEGAAAPPLPIAVAFAPVKGDRTEWAIQKLVELGASSLHPIETSRSVVVPRGQRAAARIERYRAIATEAARQSRNPRVPRVAELEPLSGALESLAAAELKLAMWEGAIAEPLRETLPDHRPTDVALLIGPEGGLTDEEVDEARAAGFAAVGLGPRILRAETAAVAATAIIQHTLGDLG
jgi:16S rRNA (uracil1498-N3)-methyltransferase